jgi:hypothetical protein
MGESSGRDRRRRRVAVDETLLAQNAKIPIRMAPLF